MLLPSCLPTALRMASPYLWDREQYRMWMDEVTVDVMKTNEALRLRFYDFTQCTKFPRRSGSMDEDAKTLLAILALVYGSSNGLGLLKEALDPVKKETGAIEEAMKDPRAATTYVAASRKKLLRTLLSFEVV